MKAYFYIIIWVLINFSPYRIWAADSLTQEELKAGITPLWSTDVITSTQTGEWLLDAVLEFIRDGMFNLLALIAIGMFLFIGGRLLMARWNPEEFKKAMKSFLYAAIWLFAVAAAWALVRFIAWIDVL